MVQATTQKGDFYKQKMHALCYLPVILNRRWVRVESRLCVTRLFKFEREHADAVKHKDLFKVCRETIQPSYLRRKKDEVISRDYWILREYPDVALTV